MSRLDDMQSQIHVTKDYTHYLLDLISQLYLELGIAMPQQADQVELIEKIKTANRERPRSRGYTTT